MSLHHVRLLEEEHGALDRASQEAFDTLAKKRFTVFYVAVLIVNVALLAFSLIYEFAGQYSSMFLVCINLDLSQFLSYNLPYVEKARDANLSFPGLGNFSCVPQEGNGLSYTLDSALAVVCLLIGVAVHRCVHPAHAAIPYVDVSVCTLVYLLNMLGPFFALDTFEYRIPSLLGARMGFGIGSFMTLWKFVIAKLPFSNFKFFLAPQIMCFVYDLVVIVPAVVWYYNADFFWFLILDALTLVEVIFSAAKQARLERQSMAVQVKHVRMQALKFGADRAEVASMLLEEASLSDEQISMRKFPWRLPDSSMRLGEQAGSGSQAKVFKATYQGAEVACKVMWTIRDFDEVNAVKALAQEAATLWSLQKHPYLLSFYGVARVVTPSMGRQLAMIFEWCPSTLLMKLLSHQNPWPAQPKQVVPLQASVLREVAAAIACLHHADIQHCDIKPENIFFGQDGHVRVADFGISNKSTARIPTASAHGINENHCIELRGTPGYISPVLLRLHKRMSFRSGTASSSGATASSQTSTRGSQDSDSSSSKGATTSTDTFDYRLHDSFAFIVLAIEVMTGVLPYKVNADFFQLTNPDHVETTIKSTLSPTTSTIHPQYNRFLNNLLEASLTSQPISFAKLHDQLEVLEASVPGMTTTRRDRLATVEVIPRRDMGTVSSSSTAAASDRHQTYGTISTTTYGRAQTVGALGSINIDADDLDSPTHATRSKASTVGNV